NLATIQRHTGHNELFDTSMAFENFTQHDTPRHDFWDAGFLRGREHGLLSEESEASRGFAHYPLSLAVFPGDRLSFEISYRQDVFDTARAHAFADRFAGLLGVLADDPGRLVGRTESLLATERTQVLEDWNDTAVPAAPETVRGAFEAQAARTPDAVALVDGDTRLSYAELDARANQWARALMDRGLRPGARVVVSLPRGADWLTSVLAVLKAGGSYVPLDMAFPPERMRVVTADVRPACVVTCAGSSWADAPADDGVRVLVDDLRSAADACSAAALPEDTRPLPDDGAYVMFTSGSTGLPKGVEATHADVVALARDSRFAAGHEVMLSHSSLMFDASTYELWVPLLAGGRVVVSPPQALTAAGLRNLVRTHGITSLFLTTALFHAFALDDPECLSGLREVWTGGEAVRSDAVRRVRDHCPELVVVDVYGPTETTTFATSFPVPVGEEVPSVLPIGRPMDNTQVYVLDNALR
ncbi:AMP-binding protein, partial [Streptomyces sp. KLOTTS4A1]|uniref:AMP-binding protein n=1 Tax=Streptomyces sp. KLOTTS4A1 TaxID=3390996 RepID=UPI0039F4B239